jgi:hypothetical protein
MSTPYEFESWNSDVELGDGREFEDSEAEWEAEFRRPARRPRPVARPGIIPRPPWRPRPVARPGIIPRRPFRPLPFRGWRPTRWPRPPRPVYYPVILPQWGGWPPESPPREPAAGPRGGGAPPAEPAFAEPPLAEPAFAEPPGAEPPLAEPPGAEPAAAAAPDMEPPAAEPPVAQPSAGMPPGAEPSGASGEPPSEEFYIEPEAFEYEAELGETFEGAPGEFEAWEAETQDWVSKLTPLLNKYRGDIPLDYLIGWISVESDGRIGEVTASKDERGYFQLDPDNSRSIKADHRRLSTDSEYSIRAGIQFVRYLAAIAKKMGYEYGKGIFWHVVKLLHWLPGGVRVILDDMRQQGVKPTTWDEFKQHVIDRRQQIRQEIKRRFRGTWDPLRGIRNVDLLLERARSLSPSAPSGGSIGGGSSSSAREVGTFSEAEFGMQPEAFEYEGEEGEAFEYEGEESEAFETEAPSGWRPPYLPQPRRAPWPQPRPAQVQWPAPQSAPAGPCNFRPSRHGFKFANYFALPAAITRPLSRLGIPIGSGAYGLCGGMSCLAGDLFAFRIRAPTRTTVPPIGSGFYNKLVQRQLDSLKLNLVSVPGTGIPLPVPMPGFAWPVLKFWAWMGLPDSGRGSTAERTTAEVRRVIAALRRGRFAVLGLVLVSRSTGSLTDNHQVLAYCVWERTPNHFEFAIYDPNHPLRDDVRIEVRIVGGEARAMHLVPSRGGGAPAPMRIRGFFQMPYAPKRP